MKKKDRKANSLERDMLEVVTCLFEGHPDGVIPFSSVWEALREKTNGQIYQFNENATETEAYSTIHKRTVSKTLRDRFGAKNPQKRNSNQRSLVFNIEETRKHLYNYTK